jgi:predicted dinucleotide-binding enzyme
MKIAVLGTGPVGRNLATKLVQLGHEVRMGSRTADNKNAVAWKQANGPKASNGTFADAAAFGEIIFNCTNGQHTLEALNAAGAKNLEGKVLVDVANPLDFSTGELRLTVSNTDSLGEQVQRAFPKAKVVKALNTVNTDIQVNPAILPEQHDIFISGNDSEAKAKVVELLKSFGWKSVIDLGDIKSARGQEALLLLFMPLSKAMQGGYFNYRIVSKKR